MIKKKLPDLLRMFHVVIYEDDLLLKSQRKNIKQLLEHKHTKYLEVYRCLSFQECALNLKERIVKNGKEEQDITIETLKECYDKFEFEESSYCLALSENLCEEWSLIQSKTKTVVIDHPELREK